MKKLPIVVACGAALVAAGYCGLIAFQHKSIAQSFAEANQETEMYEIVLGNGFFTQDFSVKFKGPLEGKLKDVEGKIAYGITSTATMDMEAAFDPNLEPIKMKVSASQTIFSEKLAFALKLDDYKWENQDALISWQGVTLSGGVNQDQASTLSLEAKAIDVALPHLIVLDVKDLDCSGSSAGLDLKAKYLKFMDWDQSSFEASNLDAKANIARHEDSNTSDVILKGSMKDAAYYGEERDDKIKVNTLTFEAVSKYNQANFSFGPDFQYALLNAFTGGSIKASWETKGKTGEFSGSTDKTGDNASYVFRFHPESVQASAQFQEEFLSDMLPHLEKDGDMLKGTVEVKNGVAFFNGELIN